MTVDNLLPIRTRLTLREWSELSFDSGELVDGCLIEDEMATMVHEVVVAFLIHLLRQWLVPRGGFVGGSEAKFAIDDRRGRKPDAYAFLAGTTLPRADAAISYVPPDIMVEVVSFTPADSRRDRIDKLRDYAQFGVSFYWIVDPSLRSFEILELGPLRHYVHVCTATSGVVDPVPGCDGLTIDLDALWGEVDRLLELSPR